MVLIVKIDQLAELQMAGERSSLLGDAFHQIAIAADPIGVVIDNLVAGPVERAASHASAMPSRRRSETLPQRSGGDFDARRVTALRMPRGLASPLAEALQLIKRKIVAGEMQQAVEQHGAVAGGEHEAVAIEPVRVFGVVLQKLSQSVKPWRRRPSGSRDGRNSPAGRRPRRECGWC